MIFPFGFVVKMRKCYLVLIISFISLTLISCGEDTEEYADTTTTDNATTDSTYNYFSGSTVTVNFLRSDNSLMDMSGTWCDSLNDCSCGISISSTGASTLQTM